MKPWQIVLIVVATLLSIWSVGSALAAILMA